MKRVVIYVFLIIVFSSALFGQDSSGRIIMKPVVSDTIAIPDNLRPVLLRKMSQMCTQNGVDTGESKFIIYPEIEVTDSDMTASIPPKCILRMNIAVTVLNTETGEIVSQTDIALKSIESNEGKALHKAISRMNVRSIQLRKFITVTKNKIEEM